MLLVLGEEWHKSPPTLDFSHPRQDFSTLAANGKAAFFYPVIVLK